MLCNITNELAAASMTLLRGLATAKKESLVTGVNILTILGLKAN